MVTDVPRRPRRWILGALLLAISTALFACQGDNGDSGPFGLDTGPDEATEAPRSPSPDSSAGTPQATEGTEATATPFPPIVIEGSGDRRGQDQIELGAGPYRITTEYSGTGVFSVALVDGSGRSQRVGGGVGPATDERYVADGGTFDLEFSGEGSWRIEIVAIEDDPDAASGFSGAGNSVSGLFSLPAGNHSYRITHDGNSNFVVRLQCDDRGRLVTNEIGAVDGTYGTDNSRGSAICAWSVDADGAWEIAAQ